MLKISLRIARILFVNRIVSSRELAVLSAFAYQVTKSEMRNMMTTWLRFLK